MYVCIYYCRSAWRFLCLVLYGVLDGIFLDGWLYLSTYHSFSRSIRDDVIISIPSSVNSFLFLFRA